MKYLKKFENIKDNFKKMPNNRYDEVIYYYLLYVNSVEQLNCALEKIDIKEDFYNDIWNQDDNLNLYFLSKIKNTGKIYLSIDYYIGTFEFFDHIPSNDALLSMRDDGDEKNAPIVYNGEVYVDDYEVDSNKYNFNNK